MSRPNFFIKKLLCQPSSRKLLSKYYLYKKGFIMPKKLSKGYSYRGANMGRRDSITEPNHPVKFHLREMKMSSCGAYDQGGAYWGCGDCNIGFMFHAWGQAENEEQEMFVRAKHRQDAKDQILEKFPNAKFYR